MIYRCLAHRCTATEARWFTISQHRGQEIYRFLAHRHTATEARWFTCPWHTNILLRLPGYKSVPYTKVYVYLCVNCYRDKIIYRCTAHKNTVVKAKLFSVSRNTITLQGPCNLQVTGTLTYCYRGQVKYRWLSNRNTDRKTTWNIGFSHKNNLLQKTGDL